MRWQHMLRDTRQRMHNLEYIWPIEVDSYRGCLLNVEGLTTKFCIVLMKAQCCWKD